MDETKERFINFRPLVIIALLFALGVIFMLGLFDSLLWLIPAIFLFVFTLIFTCLKKKFVFAIIFLFIYVLGFGLTALTVLSYSKNFEKESAIIVGRVCDISSSKKENQYFVLLENVSMETEAEKNFLAGKTSITVYGMEGEFIDVGDELTIITKISSVNLLEDGYLESGYYADDIRYFCSVSFDKVTVFDGNPHFLENIKLTSRDNLIKYMGREEGGISYAVLFGDKSFISYQTTTAFKESGITHILAVSGLNIGFLYALLYFFLDKFKLNRWVKFVILAICMFCYCLLCDFNPSVVRAAIMSLCFFLTKLLGKQYDSLGGLALAFLIILLVKPLYLFDVGFQLSFGAMLGMILMLKAVDRFNIKNKFLKWLISAILVSIVAQLGVIPIIANIFGYISTYSILANLIIIPVFAIYYPILCITNLFVMISPVFSFMLIVPTAMVKFTVAFANVIAGLPYAYIKVFTMGTTATILFYFSMFAIGGFVNFVGSIKFMFVSALLSACTLFITINNIPWISNSNNFILENNYGCESKIMTESNNLFLINIDTSYDGLRTLRRKLKEDRVSKVYSLIFTKLNTFDSSDIISFLNDYSVSVIYLPEGHTAKIPLLMQNYNVIELKENIVTYDFIKIEIYNFELGEILKIRIDDNTLAFGWGEFTQEEVLIIKSQFTKNVSVVCLEESAKILEDNRIFKSNNYLYYGEECDIVI